MDQPESTSNYFAADWNHVALVRVEKRSRSSIMESRSACRRNRERLAVGGRGLIGTRGSEIRRVQRVQLRVIAAISVSWSKSRGGKRRNEERNVGKSRSRLENIGRSRNSMGIAIFFSRCVTGRNENRRARSDRTFFPVNYPLVASPITMINGYERSSHYRGR